MTLSTGIWLIHAISGHVHSFDTLGFQELQASRRFYKPWHAILSIVYLSRPRTHIGFVTSAILSRYYSPAAQGPIRYLDTLEQEIVHRTAISSEHHVQPIHWAADAGAAYLNKAQISQHFPLMKLLKTSGFKPITREFRSVVRGKSNWSHSSFAHAKRRL